MTKIDQFLKFFQNKKKSIQQTKNTITNTIFKGIVISGGSEGIGLMVRKILSGKFQSRPGLVFILFQN